MKYFIKSKKLCHILMGLLVAFLISLIAMQPAFAGYPYCISGCTANDVEVNQFKLVPSGTCSGGLADATLNMYYRVNGGTRYCIWVVFDIWTDAGIYKDNKIILLNTKSKTPPNDPDYIESIPITWPCGESLYIKDLHVEWSENAACSGTCADANPNNPKCFNGTDQEVLIPGIKVKKVTNGGCFDTKFDINVDSGAPHSFECGEEWTFSPLSPGTHIVSEAVPPGWELTSISCTTGDGASESCPRTGNGVSVTLSEGERVVVTFTNTKLGTIKAIKDAVPNDLQDFSFTASGTGYTNTFTLDDDLGVAEADDIYLNEKTLSNLKPGTYTITEAALGGWDLTDLVITDPDGGSTVDVAGRTATIDVDPGESITATFTNKKRGSISVVKDANPNDAADFAFTATGPESYSSPFSLDDDSDGTLSNTKTLSNLKPGTYTITEAALGGWDLTDLVITDPDGGSAVNVAGRTATIDLDPGESITATFTNKKRGSISVVKDANPNDAADFAFTATGPESYSSPFSLDDDSDGTLSNTQTLSDLKPGTYTITEAALGGWDLTDLVINDPDGGSTVNVAARTATIDLDPGESITATFTNKKRGSISVVKDANPNDAADFAFTSTGPESYSSPFSLDDDSDGTLSNTQTLSNLKPGTYTITEAALGGWDLTDLVITDPDGGSTVDVAGRTATIDLDPGESITATFTNTKRGHITVAKETNPDGDLQTFEFTPSWGDIFYLKDNDQPHDSGNLAPGVYTICETSIPSGWGIYGIVANGDASVEYSSAPPSESTWHGTYQQGDTCVRITLGAGQSASITFTDWRCQEADAGTPDQICVGYPIVLTGTFQYATSVVWTKVSGSGTLIPSYDGYDYKAQYTPSASTTDTAKHILRFTAYGVCGGMEGISSDVEVYAVEHPVATITILEPAGGA